MAELAGDQQIKIKVKVRNKRTCCICHDPNKEVQIHHIDGNPNNTTEENLAILCLAHHSQATIGLQKGRGGFGTKLTPDEVRFHKELWETRVAYEYRVQRKITPIRQRHQLEILYNFEINKKKNEILAPNNESKALIKQKFNFLTQLLVEEFISGLNLRKIILAAFSDIAIQSAGEKYLSQELLSALIDLHLYLIGPEDVPMKRDDRKSLLKSIDIIEGNNWFLLCFDRR